MAGARPGTANSSSFHCRQRCRLLQAYCALLLLLRWLLKFICCCLLWHLAFWQLLLLLTSTVLQLLPTTASIISVRCLVNHKPCWCCRCACRRCCSSRSFWVSLFVGSTSLS